MSTPVVSVLSGRKVPSGGIGETEVLPSTKDCSSLPDLTKERVTTMLEMLEEYGVTPQNALTPDSLVLLRALYEQKVTELDAGKEQKEKEESSLLSQLSEIVKSQDETVSQVDSLRSQLRETVFALMQENPATSVLLTETIQELKSDVQNERDYQISLVKRATAQSVPQVSDEWNEKKAEASQIADGIRKIFDTMQTMEIPLPTSKAFKEAFPLKEQTEDGTKNGKFLPKLSMLPRTPGESATPLGRNAVIKRMRFNWNGEDLPEGVWVSDVVHDYVSDMKTGFVVDVRALMDSVEKSGQKFTSNEPWEVEFPTGILKGWNPKTEK